MRFLSPSAFGVFALACALFPWGCASISPARNDSKGPAIVGTGASTSQAVTSAGGSVTLEGTTITIPAGALAGKQTISIQSTTTAPPIGVTNLSPIYQFGPAGLVFSKPVTIQLHFTSNGNRPAFAWTNPNSTVFGVLPSAASGATISAQVTHFSQGFVADALTVAALPAGSDDGGTDDATLPGSDEAGSPTCPVCSNGACAATCPPGNTTCGSSATCVSTDTDPANCGACGNVCGNGQTCLSGICVTSCYSGAITSACSAGIPLDGGGIDCSPCGGSSTVCGSLCADLSADPGNCGGCGKACSPGQTCTAGACSAVCPGTDVCADRGCTAACPAGQSVCNTVDSNTTGFCTNTQSDSLNCGTCGIACATGLQCVSGVCVESCVGPVATDPGTATPLSDGGIACTSPFSPCDQQCVNLASDPTNCGACGALCTEGQLCSSGACVTLCTGTEICTAGGTCAATCPSGQSVCTLRGATATSTCTDLQSDPANCGACAQQCATNQACSGGTCVDTCQ